MANTIIVAYAYSKENPLNQVPAELKEVIAILEKTACSVERKESVTQEVLEQRFALLKKEILIFHFCGHAGSTGLELNGDGSEEMNFIDMEAFAQIIGQDGQGLKLVFLNGCSTQPQVQHLLAQGVPAVIATNWPLQDAYAYQFAQRFYANFTNKEYGFTLQEAFKRTLDSFQSNEKDRFFDAAGRVKPAKLLPEDLRGNLDVDLEAPTQIYQLDGDPLILQQRFADWQTTLQKPAVTIEPGKSGTLPDQKWEFAYLLCDRDVQARDFDGLLSRKKAGTLTHPSFIFIHDYGKHCPLELARRFKQLTLREAFPQKMRVEELAFPLPDDFGIAGDLLKPLHSLAAVYAQKFSRDGGNTYDQAMRRYQYGDFPTDIFVVVHHKLDVGFWHDDLEMLFKYYVGDFANELPGGLRKQLLVICTFAYAEKNRDVANAEKYRTLFKGICESPACQGRILHFPSLPAVSYSHVRQWYVQVFDRDFDDEKYPDVPETMTFKEAMPILQTIIADYNGHP